MFHSFTFIIFLALIFALIIISAYVPVVWLSICFLFSLFSFHCLLTSLGISLLAFFDYLASATLDSSSFM